MSRWKIPNAIGGESKVTRKNKDAGKALKFVIKVMRRGKFGHLWNKLSHEWIHEEEKKN